MIDDQDSSSVTRISSDALALQGAITGDAGSVDIRVQILNGGSISSNTNNKGNAGRVTVQASDITIRGGADDISFIDSRTSGRGQAGQITVSARGTLNLIQGGSISTYTAAQGNGGSITVEANNLLIDGFIAGIFSGTRIPKSGIVPSGHAGSVDIVINDSLEIFRGEVLVVILLVKVVRAPFRYKQTIF